MKRAPCILVLAAAAFWGWGLSMLPGGFVLGLFLTAPRFLPIQIRISSESLRALGWLSAALSVAAVLLHLFPTGEPLSDNSIVGETSKNPLLTWAAPSATFVLQRLPLFFAPVLVPLAWSHWETLPFQWIPLRNGGASAVRVAHPHAPPLSKDWIPLLILLGSVSIGARKDWFQPGFVLLLGSSLFAFRPSRFSLPTSLLSAVCALGLAIVIQGDPIASLTRLAELHGKLDGIQNPMGSHAGTLRTSFYARFHPTQPSRILFRVRTPSGQPIPTRLREATFHRYLKTGWDNIYQAEYRRIDPNPSTRNLELPTHAANETTALPQHVVELELLGQIATGLIPLPPGALRIEGVPQRSAEINRFGAVSVSTLQKTTVRIVYHGISSLDSPPTEHDSQVPTDDLALIQHVAMEVGLTPGMLPNLAVQRIQQFFSRNFTYALPHSEQKPISLQESFVGDFLTKTRHGHCEHFASATALLLRATGVPTRYATGWSVAPTGQNSIPVRARHAHAWVLAWIDGRWVDVDPTPAPHPFSHLSKATPSSGLADWIQKKSEAILNQNFPLPTPSSQQIVGMFSVSIGVVFALALLRWHKARVPTHPSSARVGRANGWDSDLFRVETALRKRGLGRNPTECWSAWLKRVGSAGPVDSSIRNALHEMVQLHLRYRFSSHGLPPLDRQRLASLAKNVVAQLIKHSQ